MQAGKRVARRFGLGAEILDIDVAVLGDLTTTTFIPAICALAGLVPWATLGIRQTLRPSSAVGPVIGCNGQQPGIFALRAGVRLQ